MLKTLFNKLFFGILVLISIAAILFLLYNYVAIYFPVICFGLLLGGCAYAYAKFKRDEVYKMIKPTFTPIKLVMAMALLVLFVLNLIAPVVVTTGFLLGAGVLLYSDYTSNKRLEDNSNN